MQQDTTVEGDTNLSVRRVVRRYLDLPKYIDLLRSQALYLQRADGFTDRFEGALTPVIRNALEEAYRMGRRERDADYLYRRSRAGSYVSCWSLGGCDNMAMWQLYGGAATSVAVTSTVGRLIDMALGWRQPVLIKRVRYIDHFQNPDMAIGHYTDLLEFKHEAYKYERELRIIVPKQGEDWERNPKGIRLPIGDLDAVIRDIVVTPEANPWFYDLVEDVTRRYGVRSPVRRSKITNLPA